MYAIRSYYEVSNYLAVVDGPNRTYPPLVSFTRASQDNLAMDNFRRNNFV